MILSGNGLEHAVLALGAMYAGVPYAPLAPAYALLATDYTTLRGLWASLRPGLAFAADGALFERALSQRRRRHRGRDLHSGRNAANH